MSKRILVVEDDEDSRRILRDLLTRAGYQMLEAENGEQGIAAAEAQRPDLILMDIQLPLVDGYEATRRIGANPEPKAIPVIAVTSYALKDGEDKATRPHAMPMSPSPTARASCSRRSTNSCAERRGSGFHTVGFVTERGRDAVRISYTEFH